MTDEVIPAGRCETDAPPSWIPIAINRALRIPRISLLRQRPNGHTQYGIARMSTVFGLPRINNKCVAHDLGNDVTSLGRFCQVCGQHMNALKWAIKEARNLGGQADGCYISTPKRCHEEDRTAGAGKRQSCRIRAPYQSWTFEPSERLFSHTTVHQPFRVALGLHHENHEITSVILRDLLDAGST